MSSLKRYVVHLQIESARFRLCPLFLLSQILLCSAAIADHPYKDPYALEPSINGGVSATGMFARQAEGDVYLAERLALELEPCINGDVSANGLFASQDAQDAFTAAIATN